MPSDRIPACSHHKASGQATVRLDGKDFYLGKWRSAQAKAEYNRIIAEWLAAGRQLPTDPGAITVAEVAASYRRHCRTYYRSADGKVGTEASNIDYALRPLLKLYGKTPAAAFSPLRLQTVRTEMVRLKSCRTQINKNVNRIRQMFAWCAANEVLPAGVYHGLLAVKGLRRGKCEARESEPVKPVPLTFVEAIIPHVSTPVAAMVRLQALTGMRSGEVVIMRGMDLDTTGKLWVYKPQHHKTEHHGHTREIYLGPKAQEVIRPFLKADVTAYLFSPAQADRARRDRLQAKRRTPLGYGNKPGSNRKRKPRKTPGEHYTSLSYGHAIRAGCDKADAWAKGGAVTGNDERVIPRWHSHQLRHTAATELRKQFGVEAAQVILGHRTLNVTEIYAEKNVEQAMRIMAAVG